MITDDCTKAVTNARAAPDTEGYPTDGSDEPTICATRWANLADDSTKKMWGTFGETGIFAMPCRHGIMLQVCDMVKSGEL